MPQAWPNVVGATMLAILVTVGQEVYHLRIPSLTSTPFTILGVGISIFLGFRNNTAYNRYWEARTLWGRLIISSRTLTRQVLTLLPRTEGFGEEVVRLTIAYAYSLRNHLQGSDQDEKVFGAVSREEADWLRGSSNVPLGVLHLLGRRMAVARERGWTDHASELLLQANLVELTEVQGGCERIKNTPVPATYRLLSHSIVLFFCYGLTFGIADTAHGLTPVVVCLVAYAYFGLDALGEEVTDPFEDDPHDLPLLTYCENLERDLTQFLK